MKKKLRLVTLAITLISNSTVQSKEIEVSAVINLPDINLPAYLDPRVLALSITTAIGGTVALCQGANNLGKKKKGESIQWPCVQMGLGACMLLYSLNLMYSNTTN